MNDQAPGTNRKIVAASTDTQLGKCTLTLECGHKTTYDLRLSPQMASAVVTACPFCKA